MQTRVTRVFALSLGLAALLIGSHAEAQDLRTRDTELAPGTTIRFESWKGGGRQVGRVVAFRDDTLRVDVTGVPATFALGELRWLDRSEGRHRPIGRTASLGMLIGGVLGAVVGGATYEPCDMFCPNTRGGATAIGGAAGVVAGATVGAIVGAVPRHRWARVPVPRRVGVVTRRGGGAGIGLAAAF